MNMLDSVEKALARAIEEQAETVEGPRAQTALQLLQAVYRDPTQPQSVRIKTAGMAIAYETPKLSVGVRADHRGMADMMEAMHQARHKQSQIVAQRENAAEAGERPVVSATTFRRVAERAMMATGDEATIGASPKRKPG
jgi:hypothetical protein